MAVWPARQTALDAHFVRGRKARARSSIHPPTLGYLKGTYLMKYFAASIALACVVLAATPAHASEAPALPSGAVALSEQQLDTIRGQGLPAWAVKLAVGRVKSVLGKAASRKLDGLLSGASLPTYADYRAAFGKSTGLVLSLLPYALQPRIAQ